MHGRVILVVVGWVVATGPAMADSVVLLEACEFISSIVRWLVGVGYLMGMIGFALLSMKTASSGRFNKGNFLSLVGGMFLLGVLPSFMAFLLSGTFTYTC